ncbi:hypothetical protein Hhel01_04302 [Haloferula helveola]
MLDRVAHRHLCIEDRIAAAAGTPSAAIKPDRSHHKRSARHGIRRITGFVVAAEFVDELDEVVLVARRIDSRRPRPGLTSVLVALPPYVTGDLEALRGIFGILDREVVENVDHVGNRTATRRRVIGLVEEVVVILFPGIPVDRHRGGTGRPRRRRIPVTCIGCAADFILGTPRRKTVPTKTTVADRRLDEKDGLVEVPTHHMSETELRTERSATGTELRLEGTVADGRNHATVFDVVARCEPTSRCREIRKFVLTRDGGQRAGCRTEDLGEANHVGLAGHDEDLHRLGRDAGRSVRSRQRVGNVRLISRQERIGEGRGELIPVPRPVGIGVRQKRMGAGVGRTHVTPGIRFHAIRQRVLVGIDVERIRAGTRTADPRSGIRLIPIEQTVAVGIVVQRIGARIRSTHPYSGIRFLTIEKAVVVRIRIGRIRACQILFKIGQTIPGSAILQVVTRIESRG